MITANWKNVTPDPESIFWNYASTLIAFNTVTPLYFHGALAASEYLVFNAAKIYLALQCDFSSNVGTAVANPGLISFYNMADAVNFYANNDYPVWQVTAAALYYTQSTIQLKNIYFSRLAVSQYTHLHFIGYKLTIV